MASVPSSTSSLEPMQAVVLQDPGHMFRNTPETPKGIKSQGTGIYCKDELGFHQKAGREDSGKACIILSGINLYSLSVIRKMKDMQCRIYSTNHELMLIAKPDHSHH